MLITSQGKMNKASMQSIGAFYILPQRHGDHRENFIW